MPVLRMIDGQRTAPESGAFALSPEIHTHVVSSREAARRILAYDFQQTADPKWAAEILETFDRGENTIERDNGIDGYFRVEYSA